MEIKHVPGYSPMSLVFLEQYDEWISAVCMTQFTKPGTHLEQPSMLNNFFLELQYCAVPLCPPLACTVHHTGTSFVKECSKLSLLSTNLPCLSVVCRCKCEHSKIQENTGHIKNTGKYRTATKIQKIQDLQDRWDHCARLLAVCWPSCHPEGI